MMRILIVILILGNSIHAQTIFGKWNTVNPETKKKESTIEVYQKDGKAYARIIEILVPERKNAICHQCEGTLKNKPILGMKILFGLTKNVGDDEWSGGKILDPKNGKFYKCYIKLENNNTLKIRGYIGFSLFGRTAYWYRSKVEK